MEHLNVKGKVWITSDTHWGHANIVRGISSWDSGYRDFNTQEEHDNTIINNINELVTEEDTLIHLGDLVFGQDKESNLKTFLSKLKVKDIITLIGNHDRKDVLVKIFGPSKVHNIYEFKYQKRLIVTCHYPIDCWNEHDRGSLMLHGHKHLGPDKKFTGNRRMDVGLDGNNMKPYLLDEVVDILSVQPIGEGRHG